MTDTRDKDMDMTEHLCTTTEAHDRFIDHTANTIVAIAESVHPGDPVAAAMLALRAAGWQEGEVSVRLRQPEPMRPLDTSDIDPETGEQWGVGTAMKPYVVSDSKDVPVGGQCPVLGDFDTEDEAAEFITTLPEYLSGRYSLDGPADDWTQFNSETGVGPDIDPDDELSAECERDLEEQEAER